MNGNSGRLQPAAIGGVVLGVASAIPILSCLNCACCALVIGGGVLAAYLRLQNLGVTPEPPYAEGAIVGLMAGGIGAAVAMAVSMPFRLLTTSFQPDLDQLDELFSELPPEAEQFVGPLMENMFSSGGFAAGAMIAQFFFSLVIYSIFATLGGILGAAIFHKKV